MKKYIGVKIVEAESMNLGDYNKNRGWTIPVDEDPKREGCRVIYEDGYVSWSPKEAFEAYRPCDAMTFGLAIEAMKLGIKVARTGWNGKGIFIGIQKGFDLEAAASASHESWMTQKKFQGFESRKSEDGEELMVSYADLSEKQKEMDRAYVRRDNAMTGDFIYIDTTGLKIDNPHAPKSRVPWLASQTDMLAEDWEIVD